MVHRNSAGRCLRANTLFLAVSLALGTGLVSAQGQPLPVAAPIYAGQAASEIDDVIRISMDIRIGDVRASGMSADGMTLYVWLTETASLEEWQRIAMRVADALAFAESVRIQEIAGDHYLVAELSEPLVLLDEAFPLLAGRR